MRPFHSKLYEYWENRVVQFSHTTKIHQKHVVVKVEFSSFIKISVYMTNLYQKWCNSSVFCLLSVVISSYSIDLSDWTYVAQCYNPNLD